MTRINTFFAAAAMLFVFGNTYAKTGQTIPWNQLGAEAVKQSGCKGLAVTEVWNGYQLECRMQALQAEVTMNGAKIISTSKSEGGGSFTIRASRLGRGTKMQNLPAVADWMTMKDGVVRTARNDIAEEYTTSGDGIRQDFVINNKSEGQGELLLDIALEGAGVTTKSMQGGIEVRLSSGRTLAYHALKVTDTEGRELASTFVEAKNNVITIAVDDKNATYPVRIDPTISDADWSALGSGVNSSVDALAADSSGNLYAGGWFNIAGGTSANYIAKWNGSAWSALGSGTNYLVYALAADSSGNLYAGGGFDSAGNVAANHVAKWNGSSWSALGSGVNGPVEALAFDSSGNLYAGGYFDTAGGVAANYIARWDGSAWSALGSGVNGPVKALAFDSSGNLYAGGWFNIVGGSANWIAKWNGTAWSALGSGIGGTLAYVDAIAVDNNSGNLYAGGMFDSAGGVAVHNIAKWDGSVWSALGSGVNSTVEALAIDQSGNLYVGGAFTTAGGKVSNYVAKLTTTATAVVPRRGDNILRPFLTYDARAGLMRFQLKAPAEIGYRIYSLTGRSIFYASEIMGAGGHSMRINTGRAARGTYIVNFKAGNESIRFRLVVDR